MNLWAIVSVIFMAMNFGDGSRSYLSSIQINENADNRQAVINRSIIEDKMIIPQRKDSHALGVKISAPAAAVLDINSNFVLWQKNAHEIRSIASITKLMTALVFLENNPGWEKLVTMEAGDETGASIPNILRGQTASVRDLFYTALIASDNNALKALVRSTGLSEEEFVRLMNQKARTIGLEQTNFSEVTGLDARNTSTAMNVLMLAKFAFAHDDIKQTVSKGSYGFIDADGQSHKIISTNNLFGSYLNIKAGKTGYTEQAGYCLVLQVSADQDQSILTVVLGSASNEDRFRDAKVLSAWILENFSWL